MVTKAARAPKTREPAATNPVASVYVDVPLAHLDRPFDYLVPANFDADVQPGSRVRLAHRDGFILRVEIAP